MTDDFKGGNFTKWMLSVTAGLVVFIGGALLKSISDLNYAVGELTTSQTVTQKDVASLKDKFSEFNAELGQISTSVNNLSTRVTRLEVRMEQDNTRVRR